MIQLAKTGAIRFLFIDKAHIGRDATRTQNDEQGLLPREHCYKHQAMEQTKKSSLYGVGHYKG